MWSNHTTYGNQKIRLVNEILPTFTSTNFNFEVWC